MFKTSIGVIGICLFGIPVSGCGGGNARRFFVEDGGGLGSDGGARDGGGDGGRVAHGDGGTINPCPMGGTEITMLPACGTPLSNTDVDVVPGCIPTVDGTLHTEEWQDASCFALADDLVVYVKYAAGAVYMAVSGAPTCGCGMPFYFDPDGNATADNDEFAISVFDDPFNPDGDRTELTYRNGAFSTGSAPAGIVTLCPGKQPNPIRYEWKLPFSALKITAGTPHTFRLAIVHASAMWPMGLALDTNMQPTQLDTWGQLSSTAAWR